MNIIYNEYDILQNNLVPNLLLHLHIYITDFL
jgi:hypothetical protein